MIYSDESETLGGLLACANKYAAADDDNREYAENHRRESGKKKIEDQAGPSHEVAAAFVMRKISKYTSEVTDPTLHHAEANLVV